jgi:hypothetical protein
VEVIIGKVGVQIGDSIHRLSLRSTPEITEARLHDGTPAVIELLLYYPAYATRFGMRPPRYTALRFRWTKAPWLRPGRRWRISAAISAASRISSTDAAMGRIPRT